MKQITVTPLNAEQTVNWTQRLENAGATYRLWKDGSIDRITLSELDAENILGIKPKPAVSPGGKIAVSLVLVAIVIGLGWCVFSPDPAPLSPGDQFSKDVKDNYGLDGVFGESLMQGLAGRLRNPNSFRIEKYEVLPYTSDSMMVFMHYSGVNDFNVRKYYVWQARVMYGTSEILMVLRDEEQ